MPTNISELDVEAYLDLEDFLNFSKESRLDSAALEQLNRLWVEWGSLARIHKLENGKQSWLAVWLPQEVEEAVDKAWAQSAGEGYLLNMLAQFICMTAVEALVPQAANGGCAPAPARSLEFREALAQEGLLEEGRDEIGRRYAVVTYYPFRGGCEICGMADMCPKSGAGDNFASVVLPGYEK